MFVLSDGAGSDLAEVTLLSDALGIKDGDLLDWLLDCWLCTLRDLGDLRTLIDALVEIYLRRKLSFISNA